MHNTHEKKIGKKKQKKPSKKISSPCIEHTSDAAKQVKQPAVDQHWEMIQKIDKLITEHEQPPQNQPEPPHHHSSEQSPIEPRTPLNKHVPITPSPVLLKQPHTPVFQEDIQEDHIRSMIRIPEEFAIDLPVTSNPEFRFIKTLPENETIFTMQDQQDARIEIIDIKSIMKNNETDTLPLSSAQTSENTNQSTTEQTQRTDTKPAQHQQHPPQPQQSHHITTTNGRTGKAGLFYVSNKRNNENKQTKKEQEQQTTTTQENTTNNGAAAQEPQLKIDKQILKLEEKRRKLEERRAIEEQKQRILEEKRILREELRKRKEEERKKRKRAELKIKQLNKPTTKQPTPSKENGSPMLDEDIKRLLIITDNLLGSLPEEVIEQFAQSEDFALYEKILQKYRIK